VGGRGKEEASVAGGSQGISLVRFHQPFYSLLQEEEPEFTAAPGGSQRKEAGEQDFGLARVQLQ